MIFSITYDGMKMLSPRDFMARFSKHLLAKDALHYSYGHDDPKVRLFGRASSDRLGGYRYSVVAVLDRPLNRFDVVTSSRSPLEEFFSFFGACEVRVQSLQCGTSNPGAYLDWLKQDLESTLGSSCSFRGTFSASVEDEDWPDGAESDCRSSCSCDGDGDVGEVVTEAEHELFSKAIYYRGNRETVNPFAHRVG
jgi:hypothetical protein